MKPRIGAYARISLDGEDERLGVTRQQEDNERLIEARGWTLAEHYIDNNLSAFKRNVVRPRFEQLLKDIDAGVIDGIVVYDLDRLARQPKDLERVIDRYEYGGRPLMFATLQADYDLSTSDGQFMARTIVNAANKSSKDTSRRQKRKNIERSQRGLPHGSRRPYGYERDQMTLHTTEAPILHKMGMKLLQGESYKEIAYWMNEEGNQTTTGKLWYPITVRNTLRRPRYAAIRIHNGIEYKGVWQPVFSRIEWDAIQYVIRQRRAKAGNQPVARKYLLTGMLRCGKCGGFLNGETKRDHPSRPLRRVYICRVQGDTQRKGGCGGVTRNAEALEHFIRELICRRLDTPDLSSLIESPEDTTALRDLLAEREAVVTRKNALIDDYADGTLDKADLTRAQARVEARLDALDRDIDELRVKSVNVALRAGETVRDAWMSRADGWRRELAGSLIESIVVHVGKTKPFYDVDGVRMRFDPDLIQVDWKS